MFHGVNVMWRQGFTAANPCMEFKDNICKMTSILELPGYFCSSSRQIDKHELLSDYAVRCCVALDGDAHFQHNLAINMLAITSCLF
jgi:hypothetical protein